MNISAAAQTLSITAIVDADIADVVALWQACGLTRPWNDPEADIALARRRANSTVLIGRNGAAIVATAMVGHDGHRGWVYYVTVDPDHQRARPWPHQLMNAAEDWLRQAGIAKLQLLVRRTNAQATERVLPIARLHRGGGRSVFAKWLDGREPTP